MLLPAWHSACSQLNLPVLRLGGESGGAGLGLGPSAPSRALPLLHHTKVAVEEASGKLPEEVLGEGK